MREHQIVITLKPEQFLQVQKLAKSAGAKSMGMFVRQKLLLALGIEASAQNATAPEIEPIVHELKRLHIELREFVNESLSMYSDSLLNGDEAFPQTEATPFEEVDPGPDPSAPIAEPPNDLPSSSSQANSFSTFANKRIASNFPALPVDDSNAETQHDVEEEDYEDDVFDNNNDDDNEDPLLGALVAAVEAVSSTSKPEQQQRSEPAKKDDTQVQSLPNHYEDEPNQEELGLEEAEAVEGSSAKEDRLTQPEGRKIPPSDPLDTRNTTEPFQDQMETTAKKTFAISPRLGPLGKSTHQNLNNAGRPSDNARADERQAPINNQTSTSPEDLPPNSPPANDSKPEPTIARDPLSELLDGDEPNEQGSSYSKKGLDAEADIPLPQQLRKRHLLDQSSAAKPAAKPINNNTIPDAGNAFPTKPGTIRPIQQNHQLRNHTNREATEQSNSNESNTASGAKDDRRLNQSSAYSNTQDQNQQNTSAETQLSPPDKIPPKHGNTSDSSDSKKWNPLENPDDDTPFSGGPPPKKRQ